MHGKNHKLKWLSFSLLYCSCFNSFATSLPPDFAAEYEVSKGFLQLGIATRSLTTTAQGQRIYRSSSITSGFIAWLVKEHIEEESYFVFEQGKIKPTLYLANRKGKKNRVIRQEYDWKAKQVSTQVNQNHYQYPLVEGSLDRSIYQLSLMLDIGKKQNQFVYHITEDKHGRDYIIKILGNTKLQTKFGQLKTTIVQRQYKTLTTTMWCASKFANLPVRIDHEENNMSFRAELVKISGFNLQ
ncbi:MAG: DUF3108 domain-containing protein [Gammaproteobacteria bacterium]|nr:DUF3108 domain-containing protein [Gammaproteobacteria bacterium]MDH5728445.1 DUF3108 domain-containing protein [Gammaproteobacteria bacterium]